MYTAEKISGGKERYLLSIAKNRRTILSIDHRELHANVIVVGETTSRKFNNYEVTNKVTRIIYRSTIIIMENGRTLFERKAGIPAVIIRAIST